MDPNQVLVALVAELDATPAPDAEVASNIGCGDLETLIRFHGEALWPRIEALARGNVRFRRALASVWAYDSPEYEKRTALLRELGENWDVTVRFVVEREDFAEPPRLSWRAVHADGPVPGGQLPRLLREIADCAEREGW